jgi:intracellular sulfur oxidation DsrE/DsrF family protein
MKKVFLLASLIMVLYSNALFAQPNEHKIIFQFTNAVDTMQQKAFVNQLKNVTAYWPDAQIEVVVYNQGLELVMPSKSKHIDSVKQLIENGVRFVVCENTMKQRNIGKAEFIPEVDYTPAGIVELVEQQERGWIYIKGGF